MSTEIIKKGTFDNLILTLDKCIKNHDINGKVRNKVFKLYKHGEYVDTFPTLKSISEFLNNPVWTINELEGAGMNSEGYSIKRVNTSIYRGVDKKRYYIVSKDGISVEFNTILEVAHYIGVTEGSLKNMIYCTTRDTIKGYKVEKVD